MNFPDAGLKDGEAPGSSRDRTNMSPEKRSNTGMLVLTGLD